MKQFNLILLLAVAVAFSCVARPVNSKYTLAKGYTVTIHGTSNLHDWDETVGTVTGTGSIAWNPDGSFDLGDMDIKMEVRSIKSTEGSMMNNNTYKALKADNDPEISMVLMNQIKSVKLSGPAVSSRINLTIAGVTKAVDMPVTATGQKNGNVVFEGSKSIKMTDYGITPPVALFGTMKTGDEITIHFKTEFTAGN